MHEERLFNPGNLDADQDPIAYAEIFNRAVSRGHTEEYARVLAAAFSRRLKIIDKRSR
jgi:hypothetical protein